MQKLFTIALAATICAAAIVTTSCKGNHPEIPTQQELQTKIIGKWKKTVTDGVEELTNQRAIRTYQTDGKVFFSQSARKTYGWVWENHLEGTYTVEGNTLYETIPTVSFKSQINSINDKVIDKLVQTRTNTETGDILNLNQPHKYVKVNVDYSKDIIGLWEGVEMTGYETYGNAEARVEYKADGTYTYYHKVNGAWEELPQDIEEWNVDGDWLATRWSNEDSEEVNYEWWDIESVNGETMKWSALREKEDGSRFNTTFTWRRIKL